MCLFREWSGHSWQVSKYNKKYFLVLFLAAPKAKDSDEEDDKKREKGEKEKKVSNKKPVETSSGMETHV